MKTMLIASTLFLASFSVSAADIIAMATKVSGFSPMPCRSREVKIHSNGLVERTLCGQDAMELATLSPEAVETIVSLSSHLVPTQLVAEQEGPSCMDAPSTTFSVFNDQSVKVDVGGNWGCKRVIYPGHYAAQRLHSILQGINDLAQF